MRQGWERGQMGEGLEEEGEKLFHGARSQQGGELYLVRGCRCGGEKIQYLYPERQRGKGGMVNYGGGCTGSDHEA